MFKDIIKVVSLTIAGMLYAALFTFAMLEGSLVLYAISIIGGIAFGLLCYILFDEN